MRNYDLKNTNIREYSYVHPEDTQLIYYYPSHTELTWDCCENTSVFK